MLVLLIIISLYHMYTTFCLKCFKRCRYQDERNSTSELLNDNTINISSTESYDHSEPTFSVVDLKLPGSGRQQSALASERGHCHASIKSQK